MDMRHEVKKTAKEEGWALLRSVPEGDVFVKGGRQIVAEYDIRTRLSSVSFTPANRVHATRRLGRRDRNKLASVIEWLEGREA